MLARAQAPVQSGELGESSIAVIQSQKNFSHLPFGLYAQGIAYRGKKFMCHLYTSARLTVSGSPLFHEHGIWFKIRA